MKTIIFSIFALLFCSTSTNAQSNISSSIDSDVESTLQNDGITKVNATVFMKQTSSNGILFKTSASNDLTLQTRLVIVSEDNYIVSNPFTLSTEFSVPEFSALETSAVAESVVIFPLIEE